MNSLNWLKKTSWIFIILILLLFIFSGCERSENPIQNEAADGEYYPASVKGYELYSWNENGSWYFSILTGTNRIKQSDEIRSTEIVIDETRIIVEGIPALKSSLQKFRPGETFSWITPDWYSRMSGSTGDLLLPEETVVDDVLEYGGNLNLDMQVLN